MLLRHKKPFLILVMSLVSLLLSITFLRTAAITHFAFVPERLNFLPEQNIYNAQTVWISTEDNVRLNALFFQVEDTDSTKALIYFHGNGGHLYHRVEAAYELHQQGYNVLLLDYRGYGLSDGSISEAGFYLDADAAMQYLLSQGFTADDIVLYGRSIGTVAALKVATEYDVSALILISPIASAAAMADVMNMPYLSPFAWGALDNIERIQSLTVPLLLMHGDQDKMVPIEQGLAVFTASTLAEKDKQFMSVSQADHHNVRDTAGENFMPSIVSFLEQSDKKQSIMVPGS